VGWSVSVLAGAVLMAIPIHSHFLLFVAAEVFFVRWFHVGPQINCCPGMVVSSSQQVLHFAQQ
jgi:hypothetical protein